MSRQRAIDFPDRELFYQQWEKLGGWLAEESGSTDRGLKPVSDRSWSGDIL